jgi:hypothetical protein
MLALVSMRGDFGKRDPWQFPMGQTVKPVPTQMSVIKRNLDPAFTRYRFRQVLLGKP